MKNNYLTDKLILPLALGLALTCGSSLVANPVNYASTSDINFTGGGAFSFSSAGTPATNFVINGGTAAGYTGLITGSYTMGGIIGPTESVTGSGTLSIYGPGNVLDLTATLAWGTITQFGGADGLNTSDSIDMTGINYVGGPNADLQALASTGNGINILTLQFTQIETLGALFAGGINTTYSGSMSAAAVPDQGTTALLIVLGAAGIGAGMFVQRRKPAQG